MWQSMLSVSRRPPSQTTVMMGSCSCVTLFEAWLRVVPGPRELGRWVVILAADPGRVGYPCPAGTHARTHAHAGRRRHPGDTGRCFRWQARPSGRSRGNGWQRRNPTLATKRKTPPATRGERLVQNKALADFFAQEMGQGLLGRQILRREPHVGGCWGEVSTKKTSKGPQKIAPALQPSFQVCVDVIELGNPCGATSAAQVLKDNTSSRNPGLPRTQDSPTRSATAKSWLATGCRWRFSATSTATGIVHGLQARTSPGRTRARSRALSLSLAPWQLDRRCFSVFLLGRYACCLLAHPFPCPRHPIGGSCFRAPRWFADCAGANRLARPCKGA